jgi:hypothetical protein
MFCTLLLLLQMNDQTNFSMFVGACGDITYPPSNTQTPANKHNSVSHPNALWLRPHTDSLILRPSCRGSGDECPSMHSTFPP